MVRSSEYPRKRNCRLDRSGINSSIKRLKIFPPQNENANTRNSTTRFSHLSGPIMPALSAMAVKTRKEIHGRRKTCIRAFCPPYRPPFFSNVVPWDCRSCKRWPRQGWKKKHPPPSIYPSLFLPIPREENGGKLKRSTIEQAAAATGTQALPCGGPMQILRRKITDCLISLTYPQTVELTTAALTYEHPCTFMLGMRLGAASDSPSVKF